MACSAINLPKTDNVLNLTSDGANGYTLTGLKDGNLQSALYVPDTYMGKKVTSIGKGAFQGKTFSNVVLGNNLQNIGEFAFKGAQMDTALEIPASVTTIEH